MRITSLAAAFALAAPVLLVPLPAPSVAALVSPFAQAGVSPVARAVSYRHGTATASAGPLAINSVEVDPAAEGIHFETSQAFDKVNAREAPTAQGLRRSRDGNRVIATINGSTFNSWASGVIAARGLNVSAGELITAGFPRTGDRLVAFGVDASGRPMIGTPTMSVTVTMPDGRVGDIARINQPALADEAVIYTSRFDESTLTNADGLEIVVEGVALPLGPSGVHRGVVREVRSGLGDTPLTADTIVISAVGAAMATFAPLAVGDEVVVELSIERGWETVLQAVGGRELLLRNGEVDVFPATGSSYNTSEPRSAVGITREGKVLMVAVDGRQPHSRGVTMLELAELMRGLGAVDAINLDGGGSTVLAVRRPGMVEAAIVNLPSSGIERTVANALHVVSTVPTGSLEAVVVLPSSPTVKQGESQQLEFAGHDAWFNGVEPDVGAVTWRVDNERASVNESGLLTALDPGGVTVHAEAGGWAASAEVTITADLGVLAVEAPRVTLVAGVVSARKRVPLDIQLAAANPRSRVTLIELQRRVDGGSWVDVPLLAAAPSTHRRAFAFGRLHQLRVRATDANGQRSAWVLGQPFRLIHHDASGVGVTRTDDWVTVSSLYATDGRLERAGTVAARLALTAEAAQVAIIGQRGQRHGTAAIHVDDALATTLDLRASTLQWRRVLWASGASESGAPLLTTVAISNASSGSRTRVDIDAFVVLLQPAQ